MTRFGGLPAGHPGIRTTRHFYGWRVRGWHCMLKRRRDTPVGCYVAGGSEVRGNPWSPPRSFDYIFTDHAIRELQRRGLHKEDLDDVLRGYEASLGVRLGRVVLQSKTQEGGTEYLLRIFVDIDRNPAEIVTAYRTSKVSKYWRD